MCVLLICEVTNLVWSDRHALLPAISRGAKQQVFVRSSFSVMGMLAAVSCLLVLSGCGAFVQQKVLYDESDIQVGIETDVSTNNRVSPPVLNRHPADLTPREIRALLSTLQVSGWSGTMVGVFSAAQPKPVFTQAELILLSEPLTAALHQSTSRERIFFRITNPAAPYDTDRTAGSLFFRDGYLHVVLTDHYGFLKADPGGGETRDLRDTKGMRLWVAAPGRVATVPEEKTPRWTAFEKVHVSFVPEEILAAQGKPNSPAGIAQSPAISPANEPRANKSDASGTVASESEKTLRSELRELTNSNLELRGRLEEQNKQMEQLKDRLDQLRPESKTAQPKSQPARKLTLP